MKVLRHEVKKPGCRAEVLSYFRSKLDCNVTSPDQIAVVGDRLFTDVMMANLMGGYGVWVRDGVVERKSFVRFHSLLSMAPWVHLQSLTNAAVVCESRRSLGEFLAEERICTARPEE